jgi:hypothetical protein
VTPEFSFDTADLLPDRAGFCSVVFGPEFAGGDQDLRETTLTMPLDCLKTILDINDAGEETVCLPRGNSEGRA